MYMYMKLHIHNELLRQEATVERETSALLKITQGVFHHVKERPGLAKKDRRSFRKFPSEMQKQRAAVIRSILQPEIGPNIKIFYGRAFVIT